jgi:hypothetical protein
MIKIKERDRKSRMLFWGTVLLPVGAFLLGYIVKISRWTK